MKVKELKRYLNSLSEDFDNKEVNFYDYANNKAYPTKEIVYIVDESDDKYLDLVFNYNED